MTPPISERELDAMLQEALVDAYGEYEERTALHTIVEDRLQLPFTTRVLGIAVTVERLESRGPCLTALCRAGTHRQPIDLLDLPLPTPPPIGAEWIAVLRHYDSCWSPRS
ncbi:hypothetical protein [Streptomyces himalayensis]|nr:hypothetical protein [Streptomyces himalayensis]